MKKHSKEKTNENKERKDLTEGREVGIVRELSGKRKKRRRKEREKNR